MVVSKNLHEFGPQDTECTLDPIQDEDGNPLLDESGNNLCPATSVPIAGMRMLISVGNFDTFELPLMEFDELGTTAMNYDFDVDWGDTNSDTVTAFDDPGSEHQYVTGGQYIVTIVGVCERIAFGYYSPFNAAYLLEVMQWDNIVFKEMAYAFYDCNNFTITATDYPNVSACINWEQAFDTCTSLITGFANWDVSAVQSYKWAFYDCDSLDADFSSWDVSNTPNFFSMFENSNFNNSSLNGWDVGSATDMNGMFWGCSVDQLDLSAWDVSNVTTFEDMFHQSNGNPIITGWDVSGCIIFTDMFSSSTFSGSVAGWTFGTAPVYMSRMFKNCNFNESLIAWNSINLGGFFEMFHSNNEFDQDISGWDISNVVSFEGMLTNASGFSTANYDLLLNGWAAQLGNVPYSKHFNCAASYTIATSQAARDYLDNNRAWTITDGGGI